MPLTPQQKAQRKTGLGASMAAASCGMSKYKTRYKLWREMVGLDEPSDEERLHQEIGHALEPLTLARTERKLGIKIIDRQLQMVDPFNPWRWVTLDGRSDKDGATVEAKSVGIADPREWGEEYEDNQVPMEYFMQGQQNLACVPDAPYCWMPVIVLNRDFRIYRIQRDPSTIALMTAQQKAFMDMVNNKVEPQPEDIDDIRLMYPHVDNGLVQATPDIAQTVLNLKASKQIVKEQEKAQEEWKLEIASAMGKHSELMYKGKLMLTYRKTKDGKTLDKDRLAGERPDIYEKYLKDKPGHRMMLIKV